jgi:transposase-like protein
MSKYQMMPDLTAEEYDALRANIAAHGVTVPVVVDEDGEIIDGHNRVKICKELGIKSYPRLVLRDLSEDEKLDRALGLNVDRRHLTAEKRQAVVERLRKAGWSYRRIAERLGISAMTAWGDAQSGVQKYTPDDGVTEPATVTGADGKTYQAQRLPDAADEWTDADLDEPEPTEPPRPQRVDDPIARARAAAKDHPSVKWPEAMTKLYDFMIGARNAGGFDVMVREWSPSGRASSRASILRMIAELEEWVRILDEAEEVA